MDEQTKDLIKKTIDQLVEKMGFSGSAVIESDEEGGIVCNIQTQNDSNFLIGQHGINLQAIQHLARLIIRKEVPDKIRFVLDVNDYRKQKNQSIIELAKSAADEAANERHSVFLKPMSTYERRIVHLELSKDERISTESVGEGEERKIVIKPADRL